MLVIELRQLNIMVAVIRKCLQVYIVDTVILAQTVNDPTVLRLLHLLLSLVMNLQFS